MGQWTYQCYVDGTDPNLWAAWYAQRSLEDRAIHDAIFEQLESLDTWATAPWTKKLHGTKTAVIEVRMRRASVEWRLCGGYGVPRQEFILTAIGYHKDQVYTPRDLLKTAEQRLREVLAGTKEAEACERPQ